MDGGKSVPLGFSFFSDGQEMSEMRTDSDPGSGSGRFNYNGEREREGRKDLVRFPFAPHTDTVSQSVERISSTRTALQRLQSGQRKVGRS